MLKQIIAFLIMSLVFSNMVWATSFETLNCHDQNSSTTQNIEHSIDNESGDSDLEEHCCDCNILVLPNLQILNTDQESVRYRHTIFTNIRSRYYQPPVPPPTV